MEIPYTVTARPDTGLWNAKIGIWLFLASEVMLFGGLFSAYIFLRLDAEPGYWPHGLLNVPGGHDEHRDPDRLVRHGGPGVGGAEDATVTRATRFTWAITILCGIIFLVVKLGYEWPQKFEHFGAYIKKDALEKYEQYLGNHHLIAEGLPPRVEIHGHLHNREALNDPNIKEYEIALDPVNADPTNPVMDRPHFLYVPPTEKIGEDRKGRRRARDNVFADAQHLFRELLHDHRFARFARARRACLFSFTCGCRLASDVYQRNPEHLANRVEVAGLFWHFVDLVWIFVFPLFYLL